jgi:LPXTG-site transpeptidase (sortase) family protein
MLNPLFPSDNENAHEKQGADSQHAIHRHANKIEPLRKISSGLNPAADLIRQKIQTLYNAEPSAKEKIREVEHEKSFSKHQKFMLDLSTSGKSLAEIQTAWHNYYVGLSDTEKHLVWQEFYEHNGQTSHYQQFVAKQPKPEPAEAEKFGEKAVNPNDKNPEKIVIADHTPPEKPAPDRRAAADIKRQILRHIGGRGQLKAKHHLQSLLFGLGMGFIVVIITLFSFFNEYIITPFIQPSRAASATPLIVSADNVAPTSTPEVIIPKINVEIPLNFSVATTDENQIESALEDGVVHYGTTVLPGQTGNTAFFGHSSNNIFNPGHYKFAFALLHDIVPGDTFYLTYGGKVYAYQVFQKEIVDPSNVSVLDNVPNHVATATLITCDPPGTSLHRLVVWGEQISPNPTANAAGSNTSSSISSSAQLPSNGPSLWSRMVHSITGLF